MLNMFRDNLRHLKWVLILVIVGLILYLGYYFGGDTGSAGTGDWVAKVDGEVITGERFRESARRLDENYRQMLGERYAQMRQQIDVGAITANVLVDMQLQVQEARRLGLEATTAELAQTIHSDPRFKDSNGNFIGRDRYRELINRNVRGGIADFEQTLRNEITLRKWSNLVSEAVDVTDREIEDRYRARANRTKVEYLVVAASDQKFETKATQEEVAAYYRAHTSDYKRPEGRKIRFVVVDRQAASEKLQVSDEEVRTYYDTHQDEFTRKEQRRVRHILVRAGQNAPAEEKAAAKAKAEAALARLQAGEDFAVVAKEMSDDPGSAEAGGDIGFFERGRMEPTFEQAAFGTPVGQLTGVVETPFGYHVMQPTDARAAGVQPFEEVKANLQSQLRLRQAQQKIVAEAERIRGKINSAAELDSVAAQEGLPVQEKVVAPGDRLLDLQPSPQFLETVMGLDPGGVTPPLGVTRGMAIAAVIEVVPSATRPLEEVTDRVRTDLLNARGKEMARSKAANAFARHKNLADAAKALDVAVRPAFETTPGQGLGGTGGVSPELEAALFGPDVKAGDMGVAPVPAGAILYRIEAVERFDPAQLAANKAEIRKEILTQRKAEFLQAVTDQLRQHHEIEMNYDMLGSAAPQ